MANHTAGRAWGDTPLTPPPGPLWRDLWTGFFRLFVFWFAAGDGKVAPCSFDSLFVGLSPDDTEESRVGESEEEP